jgi:hypothetical protein
MRKSIIFGIIISIILVSSSCKKTATTSTTSNPHLIFKFVFDSTQVRLNDSGQVATIRPGNAAQCPQMNVMSAHYIELAPTATTLLGSGTVLYQTPTTTAGGASAINFSQEVLTPDNGTFYSVALDSVTPGTYQYLRVSLAYQNYGVNLYYDTTITYSGMQIPITQIFPCTVASFVGVNTYITSYTVNTESIPVNGNELQGYWGFESKGTFNYTYGGQSYPYPYNFLQSGQAPVGATTVVNPLFATSPIPAGSCVATAAFTNSNTNLTTNNSPASVLTIPPKGTATSDIVVTVYVSVNHSFEWLDINGDGLWEPTKAESIVNIGIRGIIPYVGQ